MCSSVLGQDLARLLAVPERYALTADERRRLELEDWQKRLDEKERGVLDRQTGLEALSDDLGRRSQALEAQERLLSAASADREERSADEDEQRLIDQVAKTYQDMFLYSYH